MKSSKNIVEESKKELLETIKKSRFIKIAKIAIIITGGIYAFGFGCQVLNFSYKHYSNLRRTIKQ